MRTVLPDDPRSEHRTEQSSPVRAHTVSSQRWYSTEYLARVFSKRPAQLLALLAFVVIAGVLIYVFAAGQESTNLTLCGSGGGQLNGTSCSGSSVSLNTATSTGTHAAQCGGETSAPPATFDHVIIILFENNSVSTVIGNSTAPYINNTLFRQCGYGTDYIDSVQSNSLPHYMVLTSGIPVPTADCSAGSSGCQSNNDNIFHQLGSGWKEYMENMTAGGCQQTSLTTGYAARHNPAAAYTDINGPSCPAQIESFPSGSFSTHTGNLYNDLENNTMPKYSFVVPTTCNDMHIKQTCGPDSQAVQRGDTWLSNWIPVMLNSPTYTHSNTAIFVEWDEASPTSPGVAATIPNFVLSPWTANLKPSTRFDHCSTFHTTEAMLGLSQLTCNNSAVSGSTTPITGTELSAFNL